MFDFGSDLRSERRSMDSDEVGPELNDFSNGLGSRWCLAVERTGEFLDSGFAGGLEAVAVSDMAGNAMESVLETSSGSIAAEAQRIEEREERAMMTADFVQGELR